MDEETYDISVTSETNPELAAAIERGMKQRMNPTEEDQMEATVTPMRGQEGLNDMPPSQLTLEVGGDPEEHLFGTVKVSGSLTVPRDLHREEGVRIQVVDLASGEVLASGEAEISSVNFKLHRTKDLRATERRHTASIVED